MDVPICVWAGQEAFVALDVTNEFAAGKAPLRYLAGRRDRLVGSRAMAQLKRLRPDMETAVLDAPHLILQQRPVEAAQVVSKFLLSKCA